jgi:glyoxylase-like metal-dependent hydrolase (beta-lactamase superfamily II)
MRVGETTMRPVVEIDDMALPPKMFLNDYTPEWIAPHADILCPKHVDPDGGAFRISHHAWLIEANGKRILVDPCVGHERSRPAFPDMYDMLDSPFMDRLAALGVAPEDIDYVFCTHLHVDHVGWNTKLEDGRWVPTFPNARYLFSRADEDYWRREAAGEIAAEPFNAGIYDECVAPIIAAGLADLADPGLQIADCLTLIDAGGHTVGHMAGILESAGEGAVLAGDSIHHPMQVMYFDSPGPGCDVPRTTETRRRLLELCIEKDYWLAPAHFHAPHVCKVARDGEGYRLIW